MTLSLSSLIKINFFASSSFYFLMCTHSFLGLDHRTWRVCGLRVSRALQLSHSFASLANESCHSAESDAPNGRSHNSQAVLCTQRAVPHYGPLLWWRQQCGHEEIQKYGRQEVQLLLAYKQLLYSFTIENCETLYFSCSQILNFIKNGVQIN